jgi:hypothetical protein
MFYQWIGISFLLGGEAKACAVIHPRRGFQIYPDTVKAMGFR